MPITLFGLYDYEKQAVDDKASILKQLNYLVENIKSTSRASASDRNMWAGQLHDLMGHIKTDLRPLAFEEQKEIDDLMVGYGVIDHQERVKRSNRIGVIRGNRQKGEN
jgi:hypothetical protein